MDETTLPTTPSSNPDSSPMKYLVPVAVLAIIVVAAIFFFTQNNAQTQPTQQEIAQEQPTQAQTQEETTSEYANGTYKTTGDYVSPGGPRTIDLSITLENGIITDSTFVGNATDPTSQRFQGEFRDGYKEMIVGKNIDEVSLTKVAGSSLTPIGFTDALEKIKEDAKA